MTPTVAPSRLWIRVWRWLARQPLDCWLMVLLTTTIIATTGTTMAIVITVIVVTTTALITATGTTKVEAGVEEAYLG